MLAVVIDMQTDCCIVVRDRGYAGLYPFRVVNSNRHTMKVFSKSNRNNRSAPALPNLPVHTAPTSSRPKGTHKIKIFKHLLTAQMHQSTQQKHLQEYTAPLSTRDCSIDIQPNAPLKLAPLPMVNSTQCLPSAYHHKPMGSWGDSVDRCDNSWQGRFNDALNQSSKVSVFSQHSCHSLSSDK